MNKTILLVADYANQVLTSDQSGLLLHLLHSERTDNIADIMNLIDLIKEQGGDFLLQIINSRAVSLNIELTDAAKAYLMLVLGVTNPGKVSLVMHSIYMANKSVCDTAKSNDSFYRVSLSRLVDIFPNGTVSESDFEMLWDHQKVRGDGTTGSGGNLVDKYDSYYYGN